MPSSPSPSSPSSSPSSPSSSNFLDSSGRPARQLSNKEIREAVGQLFIVGFHHHMPDEDIKTLIETYRVGSVILFERNIKSSDQLEALTRSLQDIAKKADHLQPLFIGIDQENGLFARIKEPIATQLPGPMALAAAGSSLIAEEIGGATADMLSLHGINFNYSPVADVNSEPKNPVIGVRSPSDDPEIVGRIVSAQWKGMRGEHDRSGVIPCVKHFPGHGDTVVDSHLGLPVIPKTKAQLDACELVPFRRAVLEGVDAIMTAHIALPNLHEGGSNDDENMPASLNPKIISILREEMKYDGLVVSDCLEMDGVRAKYGTEKSAVMALKAGTDCVMICHTLQAQIGAIKLVIDAVKSGVISPDDLKKSAQRVLSLKEKRLPQKRPLSGYRSLLERQSILAADLYSKSTTVVRHDSKFFPLPRYSGLNQSTKIVLLRPGNSHNGGGAVDLYEEDTIIGLAYTNLIEKINPQHFKVIEIKFHDGIALSAASEQVIEQAGHVILTTRNALLSPYQRDFGLSLAAKVGSKLVVVATCEPYDFLEDESIKNYITIYEPTIPAFKAAVDVIFGIKPALGTLPVGAKRIDHEIQVLASPNQNQLQKIHDLWELIFPKWPISLARLTKLLQKPHGRYLLHDHGFCLAYLFDDGMAKISVIGVTRDFHRKGLGTAFIHKARKELNQLGEVKSFGIGSVFPRFWAGVPCNIFQVHKDFFLHRGFRKFKGPRARDLYRDISKEVAPPEILEKVAKLPLIFKPWSARLYEECMKKQVANFGNNKAWVNAYRKLASANQHHEVMVAFSSVTGEQVGWTIMCSSTSVVTDDFAFLPLCPSGENTGLIACVGVEKSARGNGVGLALLVSAMQDMKKRGIKGVFIDWVVIRGFYETLGFEPIWEYDGYDWQTCL